MENKLNNKEIIQFKNRTHQEFKNIILSLFLEKFQKAKIEVNWPFSIIFYLYKDRMKINPLTMEYEGTEDLNQKEINCIYEYFQPNVSNHDELTKNISIHYFIEDCEKPSNHEIIDLQYKLKNFRKNHINI